ncbi:MAG: bifunctional 3-(3-hydroxy-phenyl)propionate/3-hydroxycinnamic acid hydroxylase [Comamonadaceae bacterium]|nr:MAG: bifunctional 3-(3-hydroxy-phenyl)propionate/3-hydroxycinnamic acid hydroxylase [Comamonadaceae bacterium]
MEVPLNGRNTSVDVLIVGAGPVGLTLANILGLHGVRTLVVEDRDSLIDYPRGIGLDDESLRGFQGLGLVDEVLPHTSPNQIMRFVNGKGRLLAEVNPTGGDFGWPRRHAFVQPMVDAELLRGLNRFECVDVRWSHRVDSFTEVTDGVESVLIAKDGAKSLVSARYVVGCDGGRSTVRHRLGISFEGTTSPTRWLVMDIRTDPLGNPNTYVGADPRRPYVSVSIAHGIRRFEFMLFDDEDEEQVGHPDFLRKVLEGRVPDPGGVDVIRSRVYTHHSRIAATFRKGRVMLAGDAAHLMPVWQGQGYNSGIRDAVNLGWKLVAVVKGLATADLLDTYDIERRGHASAMIKLSTTVGRIISPTNRLVAAIRDSVAAAISLVPALKRYIVEMRFKPMPRYESGAVVHETTSDASPVGRLFIQPRVDTRTRDDVLLDDVIGPWFAVLCWNNDPSVVLGDLEFAKWKALGARFVAIRTQSQLNWTGQDHPDVEIVGDREGRLKAWFDVHEESVLFLRPDRCVAGASVAQRAPQLSRSLTDALFLTDTLSLTDGGVTDAPRYVLHVPQPAARHN